MLFLMILMIVFLAIVVEIFNILSRMAILLFMGLVKFIALHLLMRLGMIRGMGF